MFSFILSACSAEKNEIITNQVELEETSSSENSLINKDYDVPESMMTNLEKEKLGLNLDEDFQVFGRSPEGFILSYRKINSKDELVKDPKEILKSLDPAFRSMAIIEDDSIDLETLIKELNEEELNEVEVE